MLGGVGEQVNAEGTAIEDGKIQTFGQCLSNWQGLGNQGVSMRNEDAVNLPIVFQSVLDV
jgi:hypothetical protein